VTGPHTPAAAADEPGGPVSPAGPVAAAVVAAAANDVIGASGALPWYLPEDLRRFRALTLGHVVVMGRVTYDSIVARLGRPLPGRVSVVISHQPHPTPPPASPPDPADRTQVRYQPTVTAALEDAAGLAAAAGDPEYFVIGGASVYEQARADLQRVYLTRVHQDVPGDRCLPAGWLDGFELTSRQPGDHDGQDTLPYSFLDYERRAR
jgi:dihydrofolate reductase